MSVPRTTARNAAETLGVSERTIRRWIDAGRLEAPKVGGAFLVDVDEARTVLAESRAGRRAEQTELYGRYLEVCDRLDRALAELSSERARAERLAAILYMPASSGGTENT